MSNVTVIIVTHNSQDIIVPCVESVCNNKIINQIIIVDNQSNDLTKQGVKSIASDKIVWIDAGANKGFGVANNIGLEKVETPYVLLLNPDAVMQENAIEILLDSAEQFPDAAILAPQIFLDEECVQESYKKNLFSREESGGEFRAAEGALCADFLSGAVMFLNMKQMQKVGVFDPNLFLFYEDDDLCLRVREKGLSSILIPQAHAMHVMGGSSPYSSKIEYRKQYHLSWSRLYMEEKYRGKSAMRYKAIELGLFFLCKCLAYGLICKWRKARRYAARLVGMMDYIRGKQWKI